MANEQMYIEYRGDKPIAYRYGEPWVATQLFMEGGYPTPEEAMKHWEEWKAISKHDTRPTAAQKMDEEGEA